MPRFFSTAILAVTGWLLPNRRFAATVPPPAGIPPTPESYLRLADTVELHLREGVLARWFPRCIDRRHGGFRQHFEEDWTPSGRSDKALVFQSRMTWVSAEVARRLPDLSETFSGYARHGAEFLASAMWDKQCGGFYWSVDEAGRVADRFGDEKHVYGVVFAIYGLSSAYRTTGEVRALELAQRAFRWLEAHARDQAHGGYYEALARDGRPILATPDSVPGRPSRPVDCLGTRYGFKSMNSHIHALEALTELALVWKEPAVHERLREVFLLVRDRIAVEAGYLNLFFTPDWRPVSDQSSNGHDVETAALLMEAAAVLQQPDDRRTLAVARGLVDHALLQGWDEVQGGFFDSGVASAEVRAREKIWWTQAEALNALLLMHERFGDRSAQYWDAFIKQWDFIWSHHIDHVHGEWIATVSADGTPQPGQAKGTEWKAAYHNGRALLNVMEALRRLAR